jgi:hypothetical protein
MTFRPPNPRHLTLTFQKFRPKRDPPKARYYFTHKRELTSPGPRDTPRGRGDRVEAPDQPHMGEHQLISFPPKKYFRPKKSLICFSVQHSQMQPHQWGSLTGTHWWRLHDIYLYSVTSGHHPPRRWLGAEIHFLPSECNIISSIFHFYPSLFHWGSSPGTHWWRLKRSQLNSATSVHRHSRRRFASAKGFFPPSFEIIFSIYHWENLLCHWGSCTWSYWWRLCPPEVISVRI